MTTINTFYSTQRICGAQQPIMQLKIIHYVGFEFAVEGKCSYKLGTCDLI